LHRAARRDDINIVNTLLRHGADVNAMDKAGYTHWTEILFLPNHDEVEKILISRSANVNPSDYVGISVLYTAAAGGHVVVVNRLIEAGAEPSVRTSFSWRPLVSNPIHTLWGALEAD
jgi:ankyrin repeat protein